MSPFELLLGVLLLLETLGFFPCPADCFGCWHLDGVGLPTSETLVFKRTPGAMYFPMKLPTISVAENEGNLMLSSLSMVSGLVSKGMRS